MIEKFISTGTGTRPALRPCRRPSRPGRPRCRRSRPSCTRAPRTTRRRARPSLPSSLRVSPCSPLPFASRCESRLLPGDHRDVRFRNAKVRSTRPGPWPLRRVCRVAGGPRSDLRPKCQARRQPRGQNMRRRSRAARRPPSAPRSPLSYFSTTFCTMGSASSQVNLEPMTIETVLPDGASTNSDTAPASEV